MTVSYTADVANASGFGCFTKILMRWKGSVYKLIFKELTAYLTCYFLLNAFYRWVLVEMPDQTYRQFFESVKAYCNIQMSSIPMTFGLGFYVSLIVRRWWDQYQLLPWPDSLAIFIVGLLRGQDERARLMRRNIMRYTLLSYVIVLRRISLRVRKRFPTLDHLVDAGLMRADELKIMERLHEKTSVSKWWMPLVWATNILEQARGEAKINNDPGMQTCLNEVSAIRKGLTGVQHYDTISVPLVYTQVVTWAVYTYFGAALMGAQWVFPSQAGDYVTTYRLPSFEMDRNSNSSSFFAGNDDGTHWKEWYQPLDLYVPVFLVLQFMFYVGWLKVAETLINPFGEDDDDFELNYLIDRHVQVSYMIVDDMHQEQPELLKDMFWNENPVLPYTEETEKYRKEEPKGSAEVKEEADNASSTYYKMIFPFRGSVKHARHPKRSADMEHSSEYESIDPNIFGRMRAKLNKSQMRRASRAGLSVVGSDGASGNLTDDPNSIYYVAKHRKHSVDQKSFKSFRSYSKIFSHHHNRRRRSVDVGSSARSSMVVPALSQAVANMTMATHPVVNDDGLEDGDGEVRKTSTVSSSKSNHTYGIIPSTAGDSIPPPERKIGRINLALEEEDEDEEDADLTVERLRSLTHLSTITEQTTPYNTNPHVRPNQKRQYITAENVFSALAEAQTPEPAPPKKEATPTPPYTPGTSSITNSPLPLRPKTQPFSLLKAATANNAAAAATGSSVPPSMTIPLPAHSAGHESDSHAYYPIGSDGSSLHRPTSPRFTVEEVPNYEPIVIAKSPRTGARVVSSADGAIVTRSPVPPPPPPSTESKPIMTPPPSLMTPPPPTDLNESPMLPKRKPIMHMNASSPATARREQQLLQQQLQQQHLLMQPEITITRASSERNSQGSSQGFENVSTSSEELSLDNGNKNEASEGQHLQEEEKAEGDDVSQGKTTADDALSAFDSDTFYV